MIIVQLLGGLGNQMFQYAAARSLSLSKGQELVLDASVFSTYRLHRFELTGVFHCGSALATEGDFKRVLSWQAHPWIRRRLSFSRLAWLRKDAYVVEPHFHYWHGLDVVPDDCYLVGYWQSEKYFSHHEAIIRKDFEFRLPLDEKNHEISKNISQCNAVSIHIRRGDYVANSKTNSVHGTCSIEYYQQAISLISEQVESPEFFVFSDDIDWVRKHLKVGFPVTYIDHNKGADSYRDMQLMSLCQHNIIANSSFSWWGAWLNAYKDKIVIAPKQWFAIDRRSDDLVPDQWMRL